MGLSFKLIADLIQQRVLLCDHGLIHGCRMISFDATILGPLASKQSISWDISNWLIPPRHYFWAEIIEFFPDQRLDWLFVYIYGLATIFERIDIRSERIMKLDKNPVNTWCRSHGVRGSRKITGREMRFKKVERAWIRSSTPRRDTFSFVSRLRSIIYFLRKLFHASRRDLSQARIFFFFTSCSSFPPVDLRFKLRF